MPIGIGYGQRKSKREVVKLPPIEKKTVKGKKKVKKTFNDQMNKSMRILEGGILGPGGFKK